MKSACVSKSRLNLLSVCFVALSSLTLVGCPPDPTPEQKSPDLTKFSGIYESYLKDCGECHAPDQITYKDDVTNLDLSSEQAAYSSLMRDRELKRVNDLGCATVKYVMAGEPSVSVLFAILDSETREAFNAGSDDSCRPRLHTLADGGQANNPTAEQKQAIKNWITNGAAQN
jgi:hypothetical protein